MSGPDAVVKVGGSLLGWPGLPGRLAAYLESRAADRLVLVVGGGPFADAVRELDARHGLGEERSHALALRALDLTAQALGALMPDLRVIEDPVELHLAWHLGLVPVLAPREFLEADDRGADPLPHSWATTTDSIAARLADRLGARELVLLKSASLPDGADLGEATRLGLVDPEFARASARLGLVLYRDLRDPRGSAKILGRRAGPGERGGPLLS